MGTKWALYESRLNATGTTRTERNINRIKSNIIDKMDGNPSYKSVVINASTISQKLLINNTKNSNRKEILSLPNETFKSGDMVFWDNIYWIVVDCNNDNAIQQNGQMQKCNWILKWQKSDGTILSYPCVDESKSSSGGEDDGKVVVLGDTEHMLTLPLDDNTVLIRTPQRFFLDKHPTAPTPYKTIQNNTTSYEGLVKVIVEQDVLDFKSAQPDRIDLGICNYFSPTIPIPTPPSGQTYYSTLICSNSKNEIEIASSRYITATFYDNESTINTTAIPVFTYTYPVGYENQFSVVNVNDHKIKLTVKDNEKLIKQKVIVHVADSNGDYASSLELTIKAGV